MLKKLIFSIIGIVLILFLFELGAGLIKPFFHLPHGNVDLGIGGLDVWEYPSGYIKDRDLFWKLDSSCKEYNSKGFRDKEFSVEKDRDTLRIICMGDSITFGWPAKIEDTYPKVLERLLNSQFPEKKFEVFNAGVPGYTSYQGLVWLKKDILQYNPDLIIVYYGVNDRGGSYQPDKEVRKLPSWIIDIANYLSKFDLYKLLHNIILHFKYPPGKNLYLTHRVSPPDYKDNLVNMMKLAKANRVKALFIVEPTFYDPEKKIVVTDSNYVPPEEITQFNIYNVFKGREKQAGEIFLDDIRPLNFHLTSKGHKILAEEIFYFLINNGILEDIFGDE
jgi:lysophospholipase L1-like esterase